MTINVFLYGVLEGYLNSWEIETQTIASPLTEIKKTQKLKEQKPF